MGGHKGPEGGGQGGRVQPFGSNHTRCKTSQARMPHTVGNLKKKRYFKPSYCSSGFCWILQSSVAKKWDGGLKWAIWASIGPYNSISPLAEASSDVSNE